MWTVIRLILLMFLLPTGAEAAQRRAEPADPSGAGRVFRDCPACPEMVVVPAGEFMMGSPESEKGRGKDEGPQRKVTFAQPFAVGKFEVTFAQWDACVAEGGCTHKPGDETWGRGKRPVINVSWDDARQFVAWLAKKTGKPYRLLTEAEWEYAARGVTKSLGRACAVLHGRDDQLQAGQLRRQFHVRQRPAGPLSPEDARRGIAARATPSACTTCTATSGSGSRTATRTAMPARRRTARPSHPRDCSSAHPARRCLELLSPASALRLPLRHRCRHPHRKRGLPGCQGAVASCNQHLGSGVENVLVGGRARRLQPVFSF